MITVLDSEIRGSLTDKWAGVAGDIIRWHSTVACLWDNICVLSFTDLGLTIIDTDPFTPGTPKTEGINRPRALLL